MFVPSRYCLDSALNALGASGGGDTLHLGASSVCLCKAAISPNVDTHFSDLVEANYAGYARQAIGTLAAPFTGPGNLSLTQGSLLNFRPTGDSTPNTIYAYALVVGSSTAPLSLGVEVFDQPIPLPDAFTQVTLVPRFGFDPAANFGLAMVAP